MLPPLPNSKSTHNTKNPMTSKILNKDGETILKEESGFSYETPFIIIDIFQEKVREPNIRVFEDVKILKEIEYVLYLQPIEKKRAWAKRQKFSVHLRPKEAPVSDDFIQSKKLPINHFIEIDSNNSKVRIQGPFVHPNDCIWRDF